jgi:uncharacterized membrane protein YjjB (DUF3815 family)
VPVRVLAGAVGAAVASYAPLRAALVAAPPERLGSALFLGLQLAGAIGARRVWIPPLVIAMAGIMPLVPGMALYRGFVELVNGRPTTGVGSVVIAAGTALALCAGVVLGPLLATSPPY